MTEKNQTQSFYKWELLGLMFVAFVCQQADRQLFNVLLPLMKVDLGFSDEQMGLISTILFWSYGCIVPFAGMMGDIFSRKKIIVISLLFWSLCAMLTGFGVSFIFFIIVWGILTGGSEAFFPPNASSEISLFHIKTRGIALAIYQSGIYVGIIGSGFLSGYLGEKYGWRMPYYLFGAFGIIWAIVLMFRMKKKVVVVETIAKTKEKGNVGIAIKYVLSKPAFWCLCLAFSGMVFVNAGYMTWMPTYLYEKFNLSLSNAGFSSVFYHYLAAFVGVLLGGWWSDKWMKKRKSARFLVQAFGLLFGAPFIYLIGASTELFMIYLALTVFGLFRGIYDSGIYSSLYEIIEPRYRSTATGLILMFAFITGGLSPYIMGVLKPTLGIANCISLISVVYVFGAIALFVGVRFLKRDQYIETMVEI
ncbi:MAG: MFS transporter [Paludibacter sp.]